MLKNEKREYLFGPISERSGLSVVVCEELLRAGWSYIESIDHPPVWRHPSFNLKVEPDTRKTYSPSYKVEMKRWDRDTVSTTSYSKEKRNDA